MNIEQINQIAEEAVKWRHELHQNPQISFNEIFASEFIQSKLTEWKIPFKSNIAKTGVVATITGKQKSNKKIALRADIDALQINEENDLEYKSKNTGYMHACGHDGHTAMLLGAAKYLQENNDFAGTAYLIFQPAEEGGAGAYYMMEEGLFDEFPADSVWGLHNLPGLPIGYGAVKSGSLMASCRDFTIHIHGKGGHGAIPHLAHDPILIGSQIVSQFQHIISKTVNAVEPAILTVTQFHAGTAFNIIPETAELKGTLRAFNPEVQKEMLSQLESIAQNIAQIHHSSVEILYEDDPYPALINSKKETQVATEVARQILGEDKFNDKIQPIPVSEDFAFMLEKKPGCYVLFGNGKICEKGGESLHTATYDFNDDLLPIGIKYWTQLTLHILN